MFQEPDKSTQSQKRARLRQTSINAACDEEARAKIDQYIASFFYRAGIPFNAASLSNFMHIIEVIGR